MKGGLAKHTQCNAKVDNKGTTNSFNKKPSNKQHKQELQPTPCHNQWTRMNNKHQEKGCDGNNLDPMQDKQQLKSQLCQMHKHKSQLCQMHKHKPQQQMHQGKHQESTNLRRKESDKRTTYQKQTNELIRI